MTKGNGQSQVASDDPLAQYLEDISSLPTLAQEEETELVRLIRRGDREALRRLVEGNLRFVVYVATKYGGFRLPLTDLIQEGNTGLIKAAEKFDPNKGVKFTSYAFWWVRATIHRALEKQTGVMGLPLKHLNKVYNIHRKEADLSNLLGRAPTKDEVAEGLGLTPQDIEVNLRATRTPIFLDASTYGDTSFNYLNTIRADFEVDKELVAEGLRKEIESLLEALSERQRDIIEMRFGLNGHEAMTLREIAKIMGLSRERIRQIEVKTLGQLRRVAKARRLEAYLG